MKKYYSFKTIAIALALSLSMSLSGCNFFDKRTTTTPDEPLADGAEAPEPSKDITPVTNEKETDAETAKPDDKSDPNNAKTTNTKSEPTKEKEESKEAEKKPAKNTPAVPGQTILEEPPSAPAKPVQIPEEPDSLEAMATPVEIINNPTQPNQNSTLETLSVVNEPQPQQEPLAIRPEAQSRKSYGSVAFSQAGTYSKPEVYKNGSIKKSAITIKNKTFTGDLTIYEGIGASGVILQNVAVQGDLIIKGGSGWLKLYNCDINGLVSKNTDAKAKIFASQNTTVSGVSVNKSTTLEESAVSGDGFKNVSVKGDNGLDLSLRNLSLNKLTTATKSNVIYDGNTAINYFYANAPTELYGAGQVNRLYVRSNGVYYDNKPIKIEVSSGYAEPARRKDNSGSNSGSNSDKNAVKLYGISDQYVKNGENRIVNVDSNGTSLKVTTSDSSIAKVSYTNSYVRLQAKKQGTTTIKVTASRNGYTSTTTTFKVIVAGGDSNTLELSSISDRYLSSGDVRYVDINTTGSKIAVTNSNRDVAGVYVDGFQLQIVAKNRGKTNVTVTASKSGYISKSISFNINVDNSGSDSGAGSSDVRLPWIDDQFVSRGVDKILNVDTNASSVKATSSDERIVRTTVDGTTVKLIPQSTGRAVITVTGTRNGYGSKSTDFMVYVTGNEIVAPIVTARLQDGTAYSYSSWVNQPVIFSLDYTSSRDLYVSDRPAGTGSNSWTTSVYLKGNTYKLDSESNKDYYFFTKGSGGNSKASPVYTVRIDKTKPVISTPNITIGKADFTAVDLASGISSVTVDNTNTAKVAKNPDGSYTLTASVAGTYVLTAKDIAGNTETKSITISTATPDKEPPMISDPSVSPATANTTWTNLPTTVSFSITDKSTIKSVSVNLVGSNETIAVNDNKNNNYSFTPTKSGTYTIEAQDSAGNNAAKKSLYLKIDQIKPLVNSLTVGAVGADKKAVVTIAATDDGGSLIQKFTVKNTDSSILNDTPAVNNNNSFTATAGQTYSVVATDNAGNASEMKTITVPSTTTPPTPPANPTTITEISKPVITPVDFSKDNKIIAFNVKANIETGDRLIVSVKTSGGKARDAVSLAANVPDTYSYSFVADETANYIIKAESEKTPTIFKELEIKSTELKLDKIAPAIVVESPLTPGAAVFTVTDEPNGSGLKTVEYEKDSGALQTASPDLNGKYTLLDNLGGAYTITATDNAGNLATKGVTIAAKLATPVAPPQTNPAPSTPVPPNTPMPIPENPAPNPVLPTPEPPTAPTPIPAPVPEPAPIPEKEPDKTPPAITIQKSQINDAKNAWQLLFTAEDDDSGIDVVAISNGTLLHTATGYGINITTMGDYQITAKDKEGNVATENITVSGFDVTKPIITVAAKPVPQIWKQSDTIEFVVSESESGLAKAPTAMFGTALIAVTQTETGYSVPVSNNGNYVITAVDNAGNQAMTTVVVTNIDKIKPPSIQLKEGDKSINVAAARSPIYQSTTASVTVNFKAPAKGESPITAMVKFGKEKYKAVPQNIINLVPGQTNSFLVKLVDAAGNESPQILYKVTVPANALTIGESN